VEAAQGALTAAKANLANPAIRSAQARASSSWARARSASAVAAAMSARACKICPRTAAPIETISK
jgi:hypothetical protein